MQRLTSNPPDYVYNLTEVPANWIPLVDAASRDRPEPKWGPQNFESPPPIGTRVKVNFNRLGTGVVEGYFVEHGYLGVHVLPDARPEWHIEQNPGKNYYLVFGIEVTPV
jgi:hypothetical protein